MIPPNDLPRTHDALDTWGKQNNVTVTYAPWHPTPSYGFCPTTGFGARQADYPSGLVIIDENGEPHPWEGSPEESS